MKKRQWIKLLLTSLLAGSLALAGCSGDDGATGPAGPPGPPGIGVQANETCTVCHAQDRVADVADFHGLNDTTADLTVSAVVLTDVGGNPQVEFHVTDGTNAVTTLAFANFRFYIAELVPGLAGDPDAWLRWAYERSTTAPGTFTNLGGGDYRYLFSTPFANAPDAANVQRLAVRISSVTNTNPKNFFHDFLIAAPSVAVASGRDTVTIGACNECHDPLAFHGGGYVDTKMCVVCHNPNYVPDTAAPTVTMADLGFDFTTMIHQIHAAIVGVEVDWSEVTYPQEIANCAKCHDGPDAANWNTVPSMIACGSCHTTLDFATHQGGQVDNSACASCHTSAAIQAVHVTVNSTANNPAVPTGAVNFEYQLNGVTVDANNAAVVDFTILADGVALDLSTYPPTGFTGGPSFLLAYALPQDGIDAPSEYNNLGRTAGQPASVSIASVATTLTAGATAGSYVATLSSAPFPVGATLRAVGLQGYFTQTAGTNGIAANTARHTRSVVMAVTGDTARRAVVSSVGCADCHEIFEGHGGNRVLTADGGVEICVMCHVPNLSTSGRGADPANINADNQALLTANGYDPANPLTFPEATNNFKDMIHGIHSAMSSVRTQDYEFVRDRGTSGVYYYNWSEVTYPGTLNNCTKCHIGSTYRPERVPAGSLVTTNVTTDGTDPITQASVLASRASVPNATDEVISTLTATCYSCHTASTVVDHFNLNGGAFGARSDVTGQ